MAIKKGPMLPSEVGKCLHSQGVAHRDIKLENLVFDMQVISRYAFFHYSHQ